MSAIATYSGIYLVSWAVLFPVASFSIHAWNSFAQVTDSLPTIPTDADKVSAATLAAVVAWLLGRTIPKQAEEHKAAMVEHAQTTSKLADKLEGMGNAIASKIDEGNKEQIRYLRELTQVHRKDVT